jgi:CRP/FNR family transcriptional regulator, cyclic AMP receptor protein
MTRTKNEKIDVLQKVPLFRACNRKELARIASLADQMEVDAGYVLTREGARGGEAFVIAAGEAEATLRGEWLATLGPGQIVGEMALLDHGPRSASVVASTPMELLVLDPRSFSVMIDDTPSVARRIMEALAGRLRDVEDVFVG